MKRHVDIIICVLLFIGSFLLAASYIKQQSTLPTFYEFHFAPAVLKACHKPFALIQGQTPTALSDFLNHKVDTFDCRDLPDDLQYDTDIAVRAWFYLLSSLALIWQWFGVSWSVLYILFASLCALSMICYFGIFRLVMGPWLALLGCVLYGFSSVHLNYLVSLRDYNKAPFALAVLWLLGVLVVKQSNFKRTCGYIILLGAIIACGYGFRPDIIILLPLVLVSLLFFIAPKSLQSVRAENSHGVSASIRRRFALVILLLASMLLVAWPVLVTYQSDKVGSCLWRFPLLGLSTPLTQNLQVAPSLYEVNYQLNDELQDSMVAAYAENFLNIKNLTPCSREYDEVSGKLYRGLLVAFPADQIIRAYRAAFNILGWRGLLLFSVFIAAVSLFEMRIALFLSVALFYLFSYPAIYFYRRHFFYLYALFWVPIGFMLTQLLQWFRGNKPHRVGNIKKPLLALSMLAVIFVVPLYILRVYQTHMVTHIIEGYLQAETTPVAVQKIVANAQTVVEGAITQHERTRLLKFTWPTVLLDAARAPALSSKMLRIQINPQLCQTASLAMTVLYQTNVPWLRFSAAANLDLSHQHGIYNVFIPVYFLQGSPVPAGIDARENSAHAYSWPYGLLVPVTVNEGCVQSIATVNTAQLPPYWLSLLVPANWQTLSLYQQF